MTLFRGEEGMRNDMERWVLCSGTGWGDLISMSREDVER